MKPITNFKEVHAVLKPLYDNTRTKYDLAIMRQLMQHLGNPQDELKVVHIAGTSGKTSTAYYAAALLEQAGATVGLTVSPHVDEVNERVQINLQPLPEAEFCTLLTEFMELIKNTGLKPSYFETLTAFAYWVFAKKHVDYAVVEVGLGGLLDGTNVVDRADKSCIITDIGLDHTEILGETLPQIATQKAGIIQPGNQVFMYRQAPEVMNVVEQVVHQKRARLGVLETDAAMKLPNLPLFQQRNLGLAYQAVQYVLQRDGNQALTDVQIEAASRTHIPARMERFELNGKTVIIDGSHNAQKLGVLVSSIRQAFPGQNVAALVGFVEGPDSRWQGGLQAVMQLAEHVIITEFAAELDVPKRSVAGGKLQAFCQKQGYDSVQVITSPRQALTALLARPEPVAVVAGSFYLLNHIRPLIVKA